MNSAYLNNEISRLPILKLVVISQFWRLDKERKNKHVIVISAAFGNVGWEIYTLLLPIAALFSNPDQSTDIIPHKGFI